MSFKGTKINPTRFDKSQIKFFIPLILLSSFMILPIIYIFSHAFKPLDELLLFPPRFLVQKPTWKNFQDLLRTASSTGVPMSRHLFNSIVIAIIMVALTVLISTVTGYVLSKKKFKAKKTLLAINQIALMFVATAVTVPKYLVVKELGLTNNFFAHIFPYLAMPVGLFLIKQFIDQVPNEVIEAAQIDGANDLRIFVTLILPLSKPALATIGLFIALMYWNDWFLTYIFIQNPKLYSLQYYLYKIVAGAEALMKLTNVPGKENAVVPTESLKLAMTVITTGPIIFLYPFVQKYFVSGLTIGAVKG